MTGTIPTFEFTTIQKASMEYLDALQDGNKQQTFYTGIKSLDASMGGLKRGELCVVGGRPSHGKSMFALQWLHEVASTGVNSLVISEEMSAQAIAERSMLGILPYQQDKWREKYDDAYTILEEYWSHRGKIQIVTSVGNVTSAASVIAQAVAYSGVEFVVIDYIQLLKGFGQTKYEQVSDVSMRIKSAAVERNVAIVALAQLGRSVESRDNIPKLRDLKDSGQIEQDADQVMFVQWPLKIDPSHKPYNEYRIYCAKNRNRAIHKDVIELTFTPSKQRLHEQLAEERRNYSQQLAQFNNG